MMPVLKHRDQHHKHGSGSGSSLWSKRLKVQKNDAKFVVVMKRYAIPFIVLVVMGYNLWYARYVLGVGGSLSYSSKEEAINIQIRKEALQKQINELLVDPTLTSKIRKQQMNNNNNIVNDNNDPPVIGHVVSLIKCGKEAAVTGFLDAAAVLRHSIHETSVHSSRGKISKYSYKMYAIVHEDGCAEHASVLERLGYTTLVRPTPMDVAQITTNDWFRDNIKHENCCGALEFIKLYAYELTDHPVVVHWDMDVAILQPLDEIYDSIIYDKDSPQGIAARKQLKLQHPGITQIPDVIDAMYTKDVTSAKPWEYKQGVQGGFLVARPNKQHLQDYIDFIMNPNYVPGRGNDKGWGGKGYGGFQGAMAYQGVVSYFYEQIYPGHSVELDPCIYNQVVADVIWRGPEAMNYNGTCRKFPSHMESGMDKTKDDITILRNTPSNGGCYDCRVLPVSQTKTVHYTACKKPWECKIPHPRVPRDKRQVYRLSHLTNITTCGLLFYKWFEYRQDFETKLQQATGQKYTPSRRDGNYHPDSFNGYCEGQGNYIPIIPPPEDFNIDKMYGM